VVASRGDIPLRCDAHCFDNNNRVVNHKPMASTSPKSESVLIGIRNNGKHYKTCRSNKPAPHKGISVGAEALEEDEHDDNDERERFEQRSSDFAVCLRDGERLIERDGIIHIGGKPLLRFQSLTSHGLRGLTALVRKLIAGENRRGLSVESSFKL